MESNVQLLHLNTNMWIVWVKENLSKSLYWFLAFFIARNPESIYSNSNIDTIIEPILKQWWDVLWFTEVFWKKQLEKVINSLEKRWYKVFFANAFWMWSQNIDDEHLYNVVWVKDKSINSNPIITKIYSERKTEAKVFSFYHLLNSFLKNDFNWSKIDEAKNVYNQLANWILDWVIMSIDLRDFLMTHLHIFPTDKEKSVYTKFWDHIQSEKAHLIFWDFNTWSSDLDKILSKPPFSWQYKWFMWKDDITYPNSYWLKNLEFAQNTLDNSVWNEKVVNIKTSSIDSLSDHKAIKSIIRV
jgi:hypothetical protein